MSTVERDKRIGERLWDDVRMMARHGGLENSVFLATVVEDG